MSRAVLIDGEGIAAVFLVIAFLTLPAAWLTHVIWWVQIMATGAEFSQAFLGLVGIAMFPLGILHGYMIWFGVGI